MLTLRSIASWLLSASLFLVGSAEAAKKHAPATGKKHAVARKGKRGRHKPEAPPPMPSRIEVTSIDLKNGYVRVALTGPARPPEARLFVLTDERGRRFVPATASCNQAGDPAPADAEGALPSWLCTLIVAPSYRHAALTGVAMEWGDRAVSAMPGQVRSRWAAASSASDAEPQEKDPSAADGNSETRPEPNSESSPDPSAPNAKDPAQEHEDDGPDSE